MNIHQPSHYTQGNYETIDIIKDTMTDEMYEGYLLGNVIKYLARYDKKNVSQDLEKSRWYTRELARVVRKNETQTLD